MSNRGWTCWNRPRFDQYNCLELVDQVDQVAAAWRLPPGSYQRLRLLRRLHRNEVEFVVDGGCLDQLAFEAALADEAGGSLVDMCCKDSQDEFAVDFVVVNTV